MDTTVILELLGLAAEHTVPAVISAVQDMNKDTITVEDVRKLRDKVKDPASYRKSE
jgi:hypothetical protein